MLAVTVALLIIGLIGVSALTGSGIDDGTWGMGDQGLATGGDAGGDAGTGNGGGVDTYDSDGPDDSGSYGYDNGTYDSSDGAGSASGPSVSDGTSSSSTVDGYVVLPSADAWTNGVEDTFNAYFYGINNGDAQLAWLQLSPSQQQQMSLDDFADAVRTTHDSDFVVQEATYTGGRAEVWLQFTSTQDPELGPNPGEGCTMWSLDYVLSEQSDGTFLIDEVAGHGGTTGHSPC